MTKAFVLGGFLWAQTLFSQELDCNVTFNTQKIEAAYRERFTTLQTDLTEFINGQQWTNTQFAPNEKISCTLAFTITAMPSPDTYKATLTVQSRRPVYYSTYNTPLVNKQDGDIEFSYKEGETFSYNEFNQDNELIALVAYYVYVIIGLDFDSFAPQGGTPYLRKAETIVNQLQGSDAPGWKAFDSPKNRHAVITALLDESNSDFRTLWYNYHRLGLDAMYQNIDKGKAQVTQSLELLKNVKSANPQTVLLSMFIDTKLDELVNIYSKAPVSEKNTVYETLQNLFPTYTSKLSNIKKVVKD